MLKGCPKCEQWKEEIELCKTKLQDLENDSALLEEMNCSITNEIAELSWDQDLFTMREVCHSIEEHICHSVFGGRALESRRYRFKYLPDDAHDRIAEVLSRFEVMEDHFIQIKTCANLAVHVNRSIIPAQRVLNLVVEICRSEKIAENFMEMLKSFEMIDGGNVHIFHSPWPRRRNRRG